MESLCNLFYFKIHISAHAKCKLPTYNNLYKMWKKRSISDDPLLRFCFNIKTNYLFSKCLINFIPPRFKKKDKLVKLCP